MMVTAVGGATAGILSFRKKDRGAKHSPERRVLFPSCPKPSEDETRALPAPPHSARPVYEVNESLFTAPLMQCSPPAVL